MARKKNSTAARAAGGSRRPPPASKIPAEDAAAQHLRNQNSRLITEAVELRRELERLRAMRASINSGVVAQSSRLASPVKMAEAPTAELRERQSRPLCSEIVASVIHDGVAQSSSPLSSPVKMAEAPMAEHPERQSKLLCSEIVASVIHDGTEPDDDGAILSSPLVLTGPSGAADLPLVEEKATAWPPAGAEREQGKQFVSELDSVSTDPPILQSVHGGVVQSSSPLASTDEVEILEEKLNSWGEEDLCEIMSSCSAAAAAQAGHQQLHEEEKKDEMMKPGNPAGAKKESKFWIFKWRKCAGIALALIIPVVVLVVFLF